MLLVCVGKWLMGGGGGWERGGGGWGGRGWSLRVKGGQIHKLPF